LTADKWERVKRIFDEALAPEPVSCRAFLDIAWIIDTTGFDVEAYNTALNGRSGYARTPNDGIQVAILNQRRM
jgi:hypothetical protein